MKPNVIDARDLFRGKRTFMIEGDADEIARIIRETRRELSVESWRPADKFDGPEAA